MSRYIKLWLGTYMLILWRHTEATLCTVFRFVGIFQCIKFLSEERINDFMLCYVVMSWKPPKCHLWETCTQSRAKGGRCSCVCAPGRVFLWVPVPVVRAGVRWDGGCSPGFAWQSNTPGPDPFSLGSGLVKHHRSVLCRFQPAPLRRAYWKLLITCHKKCSLKKKCRS